MRTNITVSFVPQVFTIIYLTSKQTPQNSLDSMTCVSVSILAAYDLGAPPELLKKIYAQEAKIQRPIFIKEEHKNIVVRTENWVQYLGNQEYVPISTASTKMCKVTLCVLLSAYAAFVKFFSEEIEKSTVTDVLEKYIFGHEASNKGVDMLPRILAGA